MLIDKRTGEVLDSEIDYNRKFLVNFIVIIDHKVMCCQLEGLYNLSGIETLDI